MGRGSIWSAVALAAPMAAACGASPGDDDGDESAASSEDALAAGATTRCPGYEDVKCVCERSRFNCELPNEQRGRNRFLTRAGDDTWGLEPGTKLYDGLSNFRGAVKSLHVGVNFGQRKRLFGKDHVYAFGVELTTGDHVSGWIDEARLVSAPLRMPTVAARNPGRGDYETVFVVKSGTPSRLVGLKVVPGSTSDHEAASDYTERPGRVVNLLYNLPGSGGVSTDTFPVGAEFHRSLGVTTAYVDLYPKGSRTSVGRMGFVYGHVGGRYGWIARAAIDPR